MSHQNGLSNNATETTGCTEPDDGDDRIQKESENVAHARMVSNRTSSRIQEARGIRLPQVMLGLVGTGIAVVVLTLLKYVEDRMKQDRQGRLVVVTGSSGPDENEIRAIVQTDAFTVSSCGY